MDPAEQLANVLQSCERCQAAMERIADGVHHVVLLLVVMAVLSGVHLLCYMVWFGEWRRMCKK